MRAHEKPCIRGFIRWLMPLKYTTPAPVSLLKTSLSSKPDALPCSSTPPPRASARPASEVTILIRACLRNSLARRFQAFIMSIRLYTNAVTGTAYNQLPSASACSHRSNGAPSSQILRATSTKLPVASSTLKCTRAWKRLVRRGSRNADGYASVDIMVTFDTRPLNTANRPYAAGAYTRAIIGAIKKLTTAEKAVAENIIAKFCANEPRCCRART